MKMSRVFRIRARDSLGWIGQSRNAVLIVACLSVFFLGCLAGWFAGGVVYVYLSAQKTEMMEAVLQNRKPAPSTEAERPSMVDSLSVFVEADPFAVPAGSVNDLEPQPVETVILTEKDMKVWGTIPGIGAWLEVGDRNRFVLVGQKFAGYTLELVQRDRIELSRGGKKYLLNLLDSKAPRAGKGEIVAKGKPASAKTVSDAGITPATPREEGFLSREKVNELLMNPYDELQKVLLVPVMENGKPAGIEVRSITDDSILATLGVSKGDVVQSVNGIKIRNMGDIANAISSLMNDSHFDVSVSRGQETVHLKYSVR